MTQSVVAPLAPVLPPEQLKEIATRIFELASADSLLVRIDHRAIGAARVARGRVRLNESGDWLMLSLFGRYGRRVGVSLTLNQIDDATLRSVVAYLDQVASQTTGDPVQIEVPIPSRIYGPSTVWKPATVAAFHQDRHTVVPQLVHPFLDARLRVAAFVGVTLRSILVADRLGIFVAGRQSDCEVTVTGWPPDDRGTGWAGQAARDWSVLEPSRVSEEAVRLTHLAAHPVALEPGRRVAILDRPAVAQLVRGMGGAFSAQTILQGSGPLYDRDVQRPKLGDQVLDSRITLSTDPNDPDGGYLPFNWDGHPLIPMTFVNGGIFERMAYTASFAASQGVSPANDPPESLRMSGGPTSVEEMIANCKSGIYVNRFAQMAGVDPDSGTVTGTTSGACLLIENGRITKSLRHFRFLESPWFIFNRIEALGPSQRAPFGYAPWYGSWPIAPTIVPPVMVQDFNFVGLAEAV